MSRTKKLPRSNMLNLLIEEKLTQINLFIKSQGATFSGFFLSNILTKKIKSHIFEMINSRINLHTSSQHLIILPLAFHYSNFLFFQRLISI